MMTRDTLRKILRKQLELLKENQKLSTSDLDYETNLTFIRRLEKILASQKLKK